MSPDPPQNTCTICPKCYNILVQNVITSLLIVKAFTIVSANLLPNTAHINSKRGMLIDCNGATFVLDATKRIHGFPF